MNEPHTAPPIHRGSMTPRPWVGLWRGAAIGLLQLLLRRRPWGNALGTPAPAWHQAAARRRWLLLALVIGSTAGALATLLAHDQRVLDGPLHIAQTALFGVLFAWVSAGFMTALMGFACLLRGDAHALPVQGLAGQTIDTGARTAVLVPICNEDIATVFGGLRATCESLRATGHASLFDVFVLSDTRDGALRAAEQQAWQQLSEQMAAGGTPLRVFYRWRRRRTKRKAGNVADFCRRWGRDYRYMVVMDADSVMSGDCIASLVKLMEANPRAGILQTAPSGCGHDTLHARAQAFLGRVTGPLFTRGLAYWQLGESHYWGHNAILRVEPFMRHCALAPLPGHGGLSGEILSHDFVEAALMRRAGYEVWLVPELDGSFEQLPPHLVDELQRDRRWCQGNLQNARLMAEPGFQPVHRAMFITGALSYLASPLWLAFVLIGAWQDATSSDAGLSLSGFARAGAPLWGAVLAMLFLPRALGVMRVLWRGEQRSFGGVIGLLGGAVVEAVMSALQAPVRMAAHTLFVLIALTGWKLEWKSPSRAARALGWRDAAASLRWLVLPLAACIAALVLLQDQALALGVAPMLLPLLIAVPLAVVGSQAGLGRALRKAGLLAIPEEVAPSATLRQAWQHERALRLVHDAEEPSPAALATAAAMPWRIATSLRVLAASAMVAAFMLIPAQPPSLSHQPSDDMTEVWRVMQLQRFAKLQAESFDKSAMQKASLTGAKRKVQRRVTKT